MGPPNTDDVEAVASSVTCGYELVSPTIHV